MGAQLQAQPQQAQVQSRPRAQVQAEEQARANAQAQAHAQAHAQAQAQVQHAQAQVKQAQMQQAQAQAAQAQARANMMQQQQQQMQQQSQMQMPSTPQYQLTSSEDFTASLLNQQLRKSLPVSSIDNIQAALMQQHIESGAITTDTAYQIRRGLAKVQSSPASTQQQGWVSTPSATPTSQGIDYAALGISQSMLDSMRLGRNERR